ncbi:hypothetical protein FMUND_7403 [Fusarium mundagurra]|uniref:Uncharacterized protein n=1 Tax=Fusarium mundagurra TaxID=1567541 RepID=A0A8H5YNI0_9HYPO|nr:hypothetical protein FMUND_7403 [Fusarium mundagurra]
MDDALQPQTLTAVVQVHAQNRQRIRPSARPPPQRFIALVVFLDAYRSSLLEALVIPDVGMSIMSPLDCQKLGEWLLIGREYSPNTAKDKAMYNYFVGMFGLLNAGGNESAANTHWIWRLLVASLI